MPEVSGSSSHVASAAQAVGGFDLHTQQGVANLLKQLRTSNIPVQTKTTIRELVLKYAQSGGNVGVREELEAMLSSLALVSGSSGAGKAMVTSPASVKNDTTSAPVKATPKSVKHFGFSGARPVPSFKIQKAAEVVSTPKTTPTIKEAPEVAIQTEATSPAPVSFTQVNSVPGSTIKEKIDPTPSPVAQETSSGVEKNNLNRILEIKREVITLVGNPVNLVDIDNAVGKQYMTSLLEAMKKTNGGTKEEAAEAMANLENAFIAVKGVTERTLKPNFEPSLIQEPNIQTLEETSVQNSAPEIKPPVAPTEIKTDSEPDVSSTVDDLTNTSKPIVPQGVTENLAQDEEGWKQAATEQVSELVETNINYSEQTDSRQLGGVPLQDIPTYGFSRPPRSIVVPPKPKLSVSNNENKMAPPPPPPAHTMKDSFPEDAAKAVMVHGETGDDLMTPDITVGLTQLLSEWNIFKGSGLFGMGPGGIDHPLYVSIKDNSMLSIMNGTFTGATNEVQQSINDYVNGWRYEQSIVPQHSETFEHFLRRVVRKVLKDAKR